MTPKLVSRRSLGFRCAQSALHWGGSPRWHVKDDLQELPGRWVGAGRERRLEGFIRVGDRLSQSTYIL